MQDPVEKWAVPNSELAALRKELAPLAEAKRLDGLNLYLYGLILRGASEPSVA